jgi:hypothetical protein
MKTQSMKRIIGGKVYDTDTAEVIADNAYWDGHNFERQGRNTFLYKTPKNNYFAVHLTQLEGERDTLEPLTQDEAVTLYEQLDDDEAVPFDVAFPGVKIEEA